MLLFERSRTWMSAMMEKFSSDELVFYYVQIFSQRYIYCFENISVNRKHFTKNYTALQQHKALVCW